MKKMPLILSLFTLFSLSLFALAFTPLTVKNSIFSINGHNQSVNPGTYSVKLTYPLFFNGKNPATDINAPILAYISETMKDFTSNLCDDITSQLTGITAGNGKSIFTLQGNYKILVNGPQSLSLQFSYYEFLNGANGSNVLKSFNFINQNGTYSLINPNNISKNSKNMVCDFAYSTIKAKNIYPRDILNDLKDNKYVRSELVNSMLFENDGVHFFVTLVQVNGPEQITIPYSKFPQFFK
ncbi:MAG: DUF4163 domain-containing protein [Fusobacteria bacterium]|nr:DUF4163 domain-containing protein [Fusobacteriota bacterium]